MSQIIMADEAGKVNWMGLPFSQDDITPSKDGKYLVWTPKLEIEACDLTWTDADGKQYPFALASAASARLPFLAPNELAKEIIGDEVVDRKNADRNGKKLLTPSQKRRNRRKAAQKKWQEANKPDNGLRNIVFAELLNETRYEFIEENAQQRAERKSKQLAKRYEQNRLSVTECEQILAGINLMLTIQPEGTDAHTQLMAQREIFSAKLEAALANKSETAKDIVANVEAAEASDKGKDIVGSALIADTDLADALAAE